MSLERPLGARPERARFGTFGPTRLDPDHVGSGPPVIGLRAPRRADGSTGPGTNRRTSVTEPLTLQLAYLDGTSVLVASGEIDIATAPVLQESLAALDGRVAVDLAGVVFLDSTGISVLVREQKRISAEGGRLVLRNPTDRIRHTLEIVALDDWIEQP